MKFEDGRWWIRINGTKSSTSNGDFWSVLVWAFQIKLKSFLSPILCFLCGHSWEQIYYYKCSVCGKET